MMRYSTDPVCRVWQVHTSLFLKKSIAHTKIVALQTAALCLRDLHLTQYKERPNLSVFPPLLKLLLSHQYGA